MATYTKEHLSGSTDGQPVKIAATATPGTLLHTAAASGKDELWLWFSNTSSSPVNLTLEWGGTTDPDNLLCKTVSIPANSGPILYIPGLILSNSKVARAFAGTANVLLAAGYVNRIA